MRKFLFLIPILTGVLISCHQKQLPPREVKDPDYKKAKAFLRDQKNDSAFYYFNQVATRAKDSLQTGFAYYYMGRIQSAAGDYFGGQESLSQSLKFLDTVKEKHRQGLAASYNELGLTSLHLKNYPAAITYFDQVLQFSKDSNDQVTLLNNKALAYQNKGDYPRALKLYRTILPRSIGTRTYARVLTNLATTRRLAQPRYNAAPELRKALAIRIRDKDEWGQNSSYAHLADYYIFSRPDSALRYAGKMYGIARQLGSPDDELEALDKLVKLSPSQGSRRYFMRYRQLEDSLQTARNAAKNQFALIRYEVEKNKADNLKLQKNNSEKQYQLSLERAIRYGAISLFTVIIIMTTYWYRKRRQQAVRESQLRLSKKVHDVVANGLYRLMKEIENDKKIEKEPVLDKLDLLYEQSRDISYEKPVVPDQDFPKKIGNILAAFAGPAVKLAVVGNDDDFWGDVSPQIKVELEPILQELMVNMNKHSQASSVAIRLEREAGKLLIYYTDNGIGFPKDLSYGNGLINTGNRIKALNGTLIFEPKLDSGVKLKISLPNA